MQVWFLKALDVPRVERVNREITVGSQEEIDLGHGVTGKAVWAPQCALCLERPGGMGSHDHQQCPLVGTLNKIRQQGELEPLRFDHGVLQRQDEKIALDMPKEVRALKAIIALFEERLKKVEAHSAAAAPNSGQGQKRKQESGGSPNAPPAKKNKGNGGQGSQKNPPGGGQQGGGKGKGPAGGSGAAASWGAA